MGAEGTGGQGAGLTIAARLVAGYEDRDLESLGQVMAEVHG